MVNKLSGTSDPRFSTESLDEPGSSCEKETHPDDLQSQATSEDEADAYGTDGSEDGASGVDELHRDDVSDNAEVVETPVKPLTKEELAAFKAAKERTGVIYISRIPPGMQPPKVRHLLSALGEIGRVYLQQEGKSETLAFP